MKVLLVLCAVIALLQIVSSARILGLFTSPSKSHLIVHMGVVKALADAGHDVTVVSTVPYAHTSKKNYKFIQLDVPKTLSFDFMKDIINNKRSYHDTFPQLNAQTIRGTNETFFKPEMQKIMAEESFDLVIMGYFYNDFQIGVAAHFKCPIIISIMFEMVPSVDFLIGNPLEISYVPPSHSMFEQPMGFVDRFNAFIFRQRQFYNFWKIKSVHKRFYDSLFKGDRYPSFEDMKKNISMVFVNHHTLSQGPVRPLVPAVVDIGGIMIKENPDPLPIDIEEFLNSANETGAVYFCLGTNVQGATLKEEKVQIMFDVMSKLKQKVLWKWDDLKNLPGKSSNILFKAWVPQEDILAHKNIKLFVTHGGKGGTVESLYHGVPMVGIPFFGDQPGNIQKLEKDGYAVGVDYRSMTLETFEKAIQKGLEDSSLKEKVKRHSDLFKDRPLSARESVVYWTEYVLRHRGAPHLQSPAVHMEWYQLLNLDVLAVIFIGTFLVLFILKLLVKFIVKFFKNFNKNKIE